MRWRLLPNDAHDGSAGNSLADACRTTAEVLLAAPPSGATWWPVPEDLPRGRALASDRGRAAETLAECAARFLAPWVADVFTPAQVAELCERALPDEPRCLALDERTWILELFHGPTAAFKDTGARVLAALVEALLVRDGVRRPAGRATVIAATTGDTGAAVAAAFEGVPDLDVVLLYPRGKISDFQERHLCSFGDGVRAFAVEGDFEDCARIVRETLVDERYAGKRWWLPANSVHPLRLLPQAAHFLWAAERVAREGVTEPAFVVPSGNLGHLTAGLAARSGGLRASAWLAAHNANRGFVDWLEGGRFAVPPTRSTWSNAMDIAAPGNRARLAECLGQGPVELVGESVDDGATLAALAELQNDFDYAACPHTAVGWAALARRRRGDARWRERPAVLLATAHPAKFEAARRAAGLAPAPLPTSLRPLDERPAVSGEALVRSAEELQARLS